MWRNDCAVMLIVLPHTLSAVLETTRAHAYTMAMQVVVNLSSHWVALIVLRRAARNITRFYPRVPSRDDKKHAFHHIATYYERFVALLSFASHCELGSTQWSSNKW